MQRRFQGTEIRVELVMAFEKLDAETQIATVSAGENMPISVLVAYEHNDNILFRTLEWNGVDWIDIEAEAMRASAAGAWEEA